MDLRLLLSRIALVTGALLIGVGAAYRAVARSLLDARTFGELASESLTDPDVAAYAADRVTDALLAQKPDLIAVRPFISATANGLVSTRAFRAMAGTAAREAHEAVFSEGTRRIVVALPDVQVLFKGVMETVSPQVAKKIPSKLTTVVAALGDNRTAEVVVDLVRAGARLRTLAGAFLLIGPLFLVLAIWLADDRRRALVRTGTAIGIAGLVLLLVMPLCRIVVAGMGGEELPRRALTGALYHYLLPLRASGVFLLGLGVLIAAGGRSLFEAADPVSTATWILRRIATPPPSASGRLLWSVLLIATGTLIMLYPAEALSAVAVVGGAFVAYAGLRELFRLLLERLPEPASEAAIPVASRYALRTVLIVAAIGAAATVWMLWSRPSGIAMVGGEQLACNGHAELCERRLDQVTFAGTHNSMSNQSIRDWMFPHHQASIAAQLESGVRSLAIDVHYGYPGGSRIRTEMGDSAMQAKMIRSVGDSGYQAVLRIRDGLVGVNESKREMYFCHGFCELGAYPIVPTLREIRDFMVKNPDEVVLLLIEDYVDPTDLAKAFEEAELRPLVYEDPVLVWPSLGALIASGRRVLVWIESGKPGVPWLRPFQQTWQETPYTFHTPAEFSCRPNRGGTSGSLFLMNHWIETTPAPRPSNAAIVNAYDVLYRRARQCERERKHKVNVVQVDFVQTGDLFRVVDLLNLAGGGREPKKSVATATSR
jgi:hypothetical protein